MTDGRTLGHLLRASIVLVVVSLSLAAWRFPPQGGEPEARVYAIDDAPESLESEMQAANDAMVALQTALLEALTSELGREGALGAIHVCRDQAQSITARVAREQGIDMGRTSHRLRNPANRPRPWVEPFVTEGAGKRQDELQAQLVDLGDRVGLVRPIGTLEMCTRCHGNEDDIAPAVREAIVEAYPQDRATGFSVGELRGWMWAETAKDED